MSIAKSTDKTIISNSNQITYFNQLKVILLLILVSWISYYFNLENTLGIPKLLMVSCIGYFVQLVLPKKYKTQFLFILCLICANIVLNSLNVLILYFLGSIIFLISEISISRKGKIWLLLVFAIILSFVRFQNAFEFVQSRTWVILASIFIFRTIVFFKQKDQVKTGSSILKRFNYFFLFPNIFAPLFPIVDYKDYSKVTSSKELSDVHLDGINLVCLGVIQLLIYRILYTYLLPTVGEITNVKSLIVYTIVNYLLVYRLMGMLNISVGLLRLFGFKLPEIFNNIFIATCVSDFFRRLNIYWKEFLLNNFYYPIYFKFRKSGMLKALSISAVITFILNWFFHAYQWFWILGTSPIRWTDTIFWSSFSIVAIVEMLYQAKYPSKVKKEGVLLLLWPLKVILTFSFIALIWSLWTSPSLAFWSQMIKNAFNAEHQNFIQLLVILCTIYVIAIIFKKYLADAFEAIIDKRRGPFSIINLVLYGFLVMMTFGGFTNVINPNIASSMDMFRELKKNSDDQNKEAEGYYDGILEFNIGSANWDTALEEEMIERSEYTSLKAIRIELDDLRSYNFKPNSRLQKDNFLFETNNFGLRDKNYSIIPNEGTTRIAFMGGSPEAGLNISNDEVLENIVEESLNLLKKEWGTTFEILNFSHNGFTAPHYKVYLEKEVLKLKPDYAFFVVRTRDFNFAYKKLYKSVVTENKKIDEPLELFLAENGIEFYTPMSKDLQNKFGKQIWQWSYNEIKIICEENNIKPVLLYIPELNKKSSKHSNYVELKQLANRLEFDFIDLKNAYKGEELKSLNKNGTELANHPNAKGHAVIAKSLYDEMVLYFKFLKEN